VFDLVDASHAYHSDQVHEFDDLSGVPSEVRRMIRIAMEIRRFTSDPPRAYFSAVIFV